MGLLTGTFRIQNLADVAALYCADAESTDYYAGPLQFSEEYRLLFRGIAIFILMAFFSFYPVVKCMS